MNAFIRTKIQNITAYMYTYIHIYIHPHITQIKTIPYTEGSPPAQQLHSYRLVRQLFRIPDLFQLATRTPPPGAQYSHPLNSIIGTKNVFLIL